MAQVDIQPWKRRLLIPNYRVGEAARYAKIAPQTVTAWQTRMLTHKEKRDELSYLQLIELAVVAAARKAGMKLKDIEAARKYASAKLQSEFPFAEYQFKTDGKHLLFDDAELAEGKLDSWVSADQGGQLVWKEIVTKLREFEYEDGRVLRWRFDGPKSPIVIDPRISFGAPTIRGGATWVIKGRYNAGENDKDIAEDFDIEVADVKKALKFEGVLGSAKSRATIH
jgi:uncharacterized protein (DUF433 family)/DNA-binding transcriptional MerR regulator